MFIHNTVHKPLRSWQLCKPETPATAVRGQRMSRLSNLNEASRKAYDTHGERPTFEEIQTGALQRIADATELMARSYITLIKSRDNYKQMYENSCTREAGLRRRITALRGVITRFKKQRYG
jgi:hypothetical protein